MKARLIRPHSIFRMDLTHEYACDGKWQWQWIDPTRVALMCDRLALEMTYLELQELKQAVLAASEV